jgi:alpha-N-arabinofuranosidase
VLVVSYHLELIQQVAAEIPLNAGAVELRITGTQELYHFALAQGDGFTEVARVNTRYLGTEVTSGYNGVVIGLYATGNGQAATAPADFDWFEYHPKEPSNL